MRYPLDKGTFFISNGFTVEHPGLDLATNGATYGNPIKAPEDGQITEVYSMWSKPTDYFGGNYVVMVGKSGHRYYLGHNSRNHVSLWQQVKEGQHIADVGSTGQSSGPHIHFEMSKNGVNVNPVKYLSDIQVVAKESKKEYKMQKTALKRLVRAMLNRDATKEDEKKYLGKEPNQVIMEIDNWARSKGRTYEQTLARANKQIDTLKKSTATPANKVEARPTTLKPGVYEVK